MDESGTTRWTRLRLRAALDAKHRADAALTQTMRQIITSGELSPEALAREFPDLTPDQITAAAAPADPDSAVSSPPPMPPVVFLRGAGASSRVFERVTAALWEQGLTTFTNRTQAMHLSRGGLAVWMLDFSVPKNTDPGETPISVGEVRAVFDDQHQRMEFKRVHGRRFDRPMRDGDLDERALASLVAVEIAMTTGT